MDTRIQLVEDHQLGFVYKICKHYAESVNVSDDFWFYSYLWHILFFVRTVSRDLPDWEVSDFRESADRFRQLGRCSTAETCVQISVQRSQIRSLCSHQWKNCNLRESIYIMFDFITFESKFVMQDVRKSSLRMRFHRRLFLANHRTLGIIQNCL